MKIGNTEICLSKNKDMNYCNYCGVELDADMIECPLCGHSIHEEVVYLDEKRSERIMYRDKVIKEYATLSKNQKLKLFWAISSITLLSGILITLVVNIVVSRNIFWAKYNLTASLAMFVNITLLTFKYNKPIILFLGSFLSTSVVFALLDWYSGAVSWGIRLVIPLILSFYILLVIVLGLIRIARQRGFNIVAIVFIAIALFAISAESFISLYFKNDLVLSWSIIAASSIFPIAALLFFVHYRLKAGVDLKRFFHI